MRFREKLARFMYGRYGADQLYNFLTVVFYLIFAINLFIRSYILTIASLVLLGYASYRVFSRNIYKRRDENEKYLKMRNSFVGAVKLQKNRIRDRKTHIYKKCPKCRATLRLPKKKGVHTVRCPRCSEHFDIKV
ncbi:MAG: zf-TFIIB domain-containing protein [Clostridia bacterium]|nr:zf-TFIIB domain-containing protein [Clostridia bacterium]